jgi:Rrf2 family nitric oxide-sensitive transcriptional repressor
MRVTLSLRGDYAVRTMLALRRHEGSGLASATRIADEMHIPARFVAHVLSDLVHAGLVDARAGRNGGYRLALAADQIDLLRVVDAAEDRGGAPRCVLRGGACDVDGRCEVHDAFASATEALRRDLARTTLAELATPTGAGATA